MTFLAPAAKFIGMGAAAFGASKLFSQPKMSALAPTPIRDDVELTASEMRRLRRRRGGGANELLGEGGAEAATPGAKQLTGE